MRITIKNLERELKLTHNEAKEVYRIIKKEPHETNEWKMGRIDELLETHGVEYLKHKKDDYWIARGMSYCNTGDFDTYTIIYDYMRRCFKLGCIGDIL